jgi:hypothetical protein
MGERVTMDDIRSRFDPEWVLIDRPETGANHEVLAGTVLFQSNDRGQAERKVRELRPTRFALLYQGEGPDHSITLA